MMMVPYGWGRKKESWSRGEIPMDINQLSITLSDMFLKLQLSRGDCYSGYIASALNTYAGPIAEFSRRIDH